MDRTNRIVFGLLSGLLLSIFIGIVYCCWKLYKKQLESQESSKREHKEQLERQKRRKREDTEQLELQERREREHKEQSELLERRKRETKEPSTIAGPSKIEDNEQSTMEGTSKIEDKKQFAVTKKQNQLATDDESRRNHNKQSTIEGPSQIEDKKQADQDERKKNDEKSLALQGKGKTNIDKQKQSVVEVEVEINPNKHLTTKNQSKIEKQNHLVDNNESKRKGKRQSAVENETVESFIGKMEKEILLRFSRAQLEEFTQNYSIILGSGGYGIVYRGKASDGTILAVKVLKDVSRKTFREKEFMAEVGTIGRTYHKNVVKLYGFCFEFETIALVYEYVSNGSLDKILFGNDQNITWPELYEIAIGIAEGLVYLHEGCQPGIIHADIKPGNVLLNSKWCPQIADFGLARFCDETHVTVSGFKGTMGYAAPEQQNMFSITFKCDVYSFGVMLFEIVGRRRNMKKGETNPNQWFPIQVWDKFKSGELSETLKSNCKIEDGDIDKAENMCKVGFWCIQNSPQNRPTMRTVLTMLRRERRVPEPPYPFPAWASSHVRKPPNLLDAIGDISAAD